MFTPERILVPTDFSEDGVQTSKVAIMQAVAVATDCGAEVIFLHVITGDIAKIPLFFLDDDKIAELKEDMRKNAKEDLANFVSKYVAGGTVNDTLKIRKGVPYDEILKEEKEPGADLITIATRGLCALPDFFYGSTTERVVRRATCNVLMVRRYLDR